MNIKTIGFQQILKEDEALYLSLMKLSLLHSDPKATIEIHKVATGFFVFISPSNQEFKEDIIQDFIHAHRLLHLKIRYSKSLGKQKIISYQIDL